MILLPIVLGYTVVTYYVFRGKVRPGEGYSLIGCMARLFVGSRGFGLFRSPCAVRTGFVRDGAA